ncbi:MAG: biotin carboxylase N-terminal domain-containing protein, partial [Acidimicrobiales bacterium]
MFARVAIVNRGEAAMRFIHAARELSVERGAPLTTIALCTAAERAAMFAREADEAVVIGGNGAAGSSAHPYLDHAELERALRESRADAVWVGWGFVAEQPDFADLCERIGVAFIGPPARAMRTLGDKVGAKRLAESVGVPVAPWSGGPVRPDQAAAHAAPIGYPLMVKASAGGGGRGIRVVEQEADLPSSVESASHEAESAFGDPSVFLERLVRDARHVEAQIVADDHGTVWALGVRDCSIQRRNQKVIEESASTALDAEGERRVRDAAIALAKAAGYRNAGTVEFLYQPESGELTFLEVNTRLQVEHTVTELTTGVDLVKLQIHVAEGGRLEGDPPRARGHAMEARLNAEDAENGFAPAPGKVTHLVWPSGPGVRVDTGISEGDSIPPQYDSMIAKVMAWGHDRQEARARLRRALLSTTAVVRGGTTNKSLLLALLDHPDVVAGAVDTGWLDRLNAGGGLRLPQRLDVALVAAAIQSYGTETVTRRRNFLATAARGRPQLNPEVGCTIDLRHGRSSYRLVVLRTGPERYRVLVDGRRIDVETDWAGGLEGRLTIGGRSYRVICTVHRSEAVVEVDGVPHRLALDAAGIVRAPSPGMVVAVPAEEGAVVEAGEPVAVIESMKMEVWIRAPAAGRVLEVMVASNTQVDAGTPLVRLEAVDDMEARGTGGPDTGRVDFTALEAGPRAPGAEADLRDARAMVLGFDYSAQDPVRLARSLQSGDRGVPADPDLLHAELGILQVFADLCMLSRNRRVDEVGGEEAHNPREYFLAYLRGLDLGQAGCPPSFVEKLSRALSHYGVDGFDRTDRLEESVHLIYKAQQRVANQLPIVTGLLERYLQHPAGAPLPHAGELIDTLDRLIVATQLRHPAVGDVARSARYQLFDRPLIDARRAEAFKAMRADLAALAAGP